MESEKFNLVFRGEVLPKQDMNVVKKNMAGLFKLPMETIEKLFSGRDIVLKKNLDLSAANRYRVAIKKAGARVNLVKVEQPSGVQADDSVAAVSKPPARPTRMGEGSTGENGTGEETSTLDSRSSSLSSSKDGAPSSDELVVSKGDQPSSNTRPTGDFEVLAVGSDLLRDDEREVVESLNIDLTGISLRESDGNLLDDEERENILPPVVADLDVDILPPGSDVINDDEKPVVPTADIAVPDLEVAPVGERLSKEKIDNALAPNVDHLRLED